MLRSVDFSVHHLIVVCVSPPALVCRAVALVVPPEAVVVPLTAPDDTLVDPLAAVEPLAADEPRAPDEAPLLAPLETAADVAPGADAAADVAPGADTAADVGAGAAPVAFTVCVSIRITSAAQAASPGGAALAA